MPDVWTAPNPDEMFRALQRALEELDLVKQEIAADQSYTTGSRYEEANYWGTRAATRKRLAEAEFLTGRGDWRKTLHLVLEDYASGLRLGLLRDHWLVGQHAVLKSVVGLSEAERPAGGESWWWDEACRLTLRSLDHPDPNERMWALSSLVDLCMVALREGWPIPNYRPNVEPTDVVVELRRMIDVVGGEANCRALWPTFRQFWRWRFWWRSHPRAEQGARLGYDLLWAAAQRQFVIVSPNETI